MQFKARLVSSHVSSSAKALIEDDGALRRFSDVPNNNVRRRDLLLFVLFVKLENTANIKIRPSLIFNKGKQNNNEALQCC